MLHFHRTPPVLKLTLHTCVHAHTCTPTCTSLHKHAQSHSLTHVNTSSLGSTSLLPPVRLCPSQAPAPFQVVPLQLSSASSSKRNPRWVRLSELQECLIARASCKDVWEVWPYVAGENSLLKVTSHFRQLQLPGFLEATRRWKSRRALLHIF